MDFKYLSKIDCKNRFAFTAFTKLLLFMLLFTTSLQGQNTNPALGVLLFEAHGVSDEQARRVSRFVETSLYKTNRFNIVTRQLIAIIEQERALQKTNIDQVVLDQGIAIGADYIVKGSVFLYDKNLNQGRDKQGKAINKTYTSTRVKYTIKIVDVKTGIVQSVDTYNGSLNGIDHHIRNFIRTEFPYKISILEILKSKGDKKANQVLVDGGYKQGLLPGVYMDVVEVSQENVDGHIVERKVEVGKLYIQKLDTGGNFARCKIYKGKSDILKKMQANVNLICVIPKSFRLFGMEYEYQF